MLPSEINNLFDEMKENSPEKKKTVVTMDELLWARETLYRWKVNAYTLGKKQAEADCKRLLDFINAVCPN